MKAAYGQGQAPTNWELEVSADGETEWTPVEESGDVGWNGNDWHVENQILRFPAVQGKALRIKINSANLQWNHYAINEMLVKNSSASLSNINIATESTSEWDSENGGPLTDGDYTEAAQSSDRPSLPMDIVLSWPPPRILQPSPNVLLVRPESGPHASFVPGITGRPDLAGHCFTLNSRMESCRYDVGEADHFLRSGTRY